MFNKPSINSKISLPKAEFDNLLANLRELGYQTVGPRVRDESIIYANIEKFSDLHQGYTSEQGPASFRLVQGDHKRYFGAIPRAQSWKQFLFPPRTHLFSAKKNERWVIQPNNEKPPHYALIGVRGCELAKKMGATGFDFASPSEIMTEINALTPSYGGITYARLEELGSLQWPCPTVEHAGTPYLHKGKFARGLGKFFPLEFKEPAELPDEEYPFTLTTGRLMFHFHTGSMTRRSEKLDSEVPTAYVEINVRDAEKLGLNGNKRVRVTSRRGEIELDARVTDDIKRGVIFIPFHFAEAAANKLTNSAIDPIAKIPEYKVCAVKVELVK